MNSRPIPVSGRMRLFENPEHRVHLHEACVNVVFWRNGVACTGADMWTHAHVEAWGERVSRVVISPTHSVGLLNAQEVAINTIVGIVELLTLASERGRALQNSDIRDMLGVPSGR